MDSLSSVLVRRALYNRETCGEVDSIDSNKLLLLSVP
jgi:hypothetical protein